MPARPRLPSPFLASTVLLLLSALAAPGGGPGPGGGAGGQDPGEEGASPRRVRWTEVEIDPIPGKMERLAKAGAGVYKQQCEVCHGPEGKGNGIVADILTTRPRDFTTGQYKFKTSIPDEMPFDEDLYRTISAGIPAAGMPSFGDLTPFERWALVAHVKTLTRMRFEDEEEELRHFEKWPARTRMSLPEPPPKEQADPGNGARLYRTGVECVKCHGEEGKGDGPSAADLLDDAGRPISPPDLGRGEVNFKAGDRPEDIFRVLTTGMAGTPMPSFASLSEKERWDLSTYVTSLYRPIDPGERVYLRVGCTSCHTIGKGKLIGPDMAGILERRERDWLRRWLKDPPSMLATDETARKLLEEYLTPMPSYGLSDKEVDLIIQFLETLPPAPAAGESKAAGAGEKRDTEETRR